MSNSVILTQLLFLRQVITMKATIKKLRDNLIPIYGKGEAEAIIRIIFHHLKGWNLTDMLIHSDDELSPFIKEEIDKILSRLKNHEPIQYITGEARFHGMILSVDPSVLIPRPETDELVDLIIDKYADREDLRVLDLCTGSGCIAIALAKNLKFASVEALDISPKAIDIAEKNAEALKAKFKFICTDIFNWTPSQTFDIIVANPPYINPDEAAEMEPNVMVYEPHQALFVTHDDPIAFYHRIADIATNALSYNGALYFEINPRYAGEIINMLHSKGFGEISVTLDSFGKKRFISCKKI